MHGSGPRNPTRGFKISYKIFIKQEEYFETKARKSKTSNIITFHHSAFIKAFNIFTRCSGPMEDW